jgi:hypothetical protein
MRSRSPDRSLSRLICPRILAPNTDYMACVVPTFDFRRRRPRHRHPGQGTHRATASGAWSVAPLPAGQTPQPVVLPVTAITGSSAPGGRRFRLAGGAPAAAAGPARSRAPAVRDWRSRFDLRRASLAATLAVEGALRHASKNTPDVMPPWPANTLPGFQEKLAAIVNAPASRELQRHRSTTGAAAV